MVAALKRGVVSRVLAFIDVFFHQTCRDGMYGVIHTAAPMILVPRHRMMIHDASWSFDVQPWNASRHPQSKVLLDTIQPFFSSPGGTVVGGMGHGWLVGSNEMPEKQMVLSVLEVPWKEMWFYHVLPSQYAFMRFHWSMCNIYII